MSVTEYLTDTAIEKFHVTQRDLDVFVALFVLSSFVLLSVLASQIPQLRRIQRLWRWSAALLLASIGGYLIARRIVAMDRTAPISSIELAALGFGMVVAAAVVALVFIVPVSAIRPAFFRTGVGLIAGATVLAASSLLAHEIIIDESIETLPQGVLEVQSPSNTGRPYYVRLGPQHVSRFTVGESQLVKVDVVASHVKPNVDAAVTQRMGRCPTRLFVRFAATGFDMRTIFADPVYLDPSTHAEWEWILTPREDGRQMLDLRVDSMTDKAPHCANLASGIPYDQTANVHVKPAFLTDTAVSQWIALAATIAGISSAIVGVVRGKG